MSDETAEAGDFEVSRVFERMTTVARLHCWRITIILVLLVGLPVVANQAWIKFAHQGEALWPLSLVNFVLLVLAQSTIVLIGFEQSHGRAVGLRGLLAECVADLPALVGISIIQVLGIALGFMLLIAPGFYAIAALSMAVPLLLNGQGGMIKALRQSPHLTEGFRWSILKVLLPVILVALVISYGAYSLCKLLPDPHLGHAFFSEPLSQMVWVLGQGLALPAIFHELAWGPSDGRETVTAEVFD